MVLGLFKRRRNRGVSKATGPQGKMTRESYMPTPEELDRPEWKPRRARSHRHYYWNIL